MDDSGNILVKRISMANIYVKSTEDENAVSKEGEVSNRFLTVCLPRLAMK